MNKFKQMLPLLLIISVLQWGLTSCGIAGGDDDDVDPNSQGKTKYEGTWWLNQAMLNGFDITSNYVNLKLTISQDDNDSYYLYPEAETGRFPIESQSFQVTDDSGILFLSTGLTATMKVEGDQMGLSFVFIGGQNARTEGTEGDWSFKFSK